MDHAEAKKILEESETIVVLHQKQGMATLDGCFTIEELHAILQLLEYEAC